MPASSKEQAPRLAERLSVRIRNHGPISFRDWMQAALYDEHAGYYCRPGRVRQGRAGDYRTAPESSPLFAATFARYFAGLFAELGSPPAWTIFEAGAGGGEFAHGVLNSLKAHHPEVFSATSYVIDEVSPDARTRAVTRLADFLDRIKFQRLIEVENQCGVGIVFSNELIDAFPVHRVTTDEGKLRELCVGLRENNFVWVECDPHSGVEEFCRRTELRPDDGRIVEINLEAENYVARAASLLERGFVITVDYGAERDDLLNAPHRLHGTLRAFHRHQLISDVLAHPGEQDLTTTVDWTQIKDTGVRAGLKTLRHEQLDQFLLHEGLLDELETLTSNLSDVDVLRLRISAREMIMPHGLAASFQVLVQEKGP